VTGGTHAGVMKYVGEAVRNHIIAHGSSKPIATIGIASWGCISNRELLVRNEVCTSSHCNKCCNVLCVVRYIRVYEHNFIGNIPSI